MAITAPKDLTIIAQEWLTATGIKANAAYTKDAITTHPDYPAMTALTDFLESGGMAYDAVQADASYIHEFNYPLLAHIKEPGNEYLHVINNTSQWDAEKDTTQHWSGIALYAQKNATWHNAENDTAQKQTQKNKYIAAAFIIAGVAIFIASVFIYTNAAINIFGLLSLAGLAISIAALGTELGYQSKIVKQVCGTVGNGGCEKVLGSKYAKGFLGITPADASVFYFAAQFILYLVGCFYQPVLSGIITISFAGIAVAVWSIYTQAVKVKEWCAICLCIVAVLIGQIVIGIIQFQTILLNILYEPFIPFLLFLFTIILCTIIYIPIKQLIKTNTKNKQIANEFKKWKTDANLFKAQWQNEPTCDNTIWQNDLLIGNANAPIRITVACNPYCGPCATAHKELDKLVEKYPSKVSVQVRLLCSPQIEGDKRTIATRAILQQAAIAKNNNDLKIMLTDWFEWMDLGKWSGKYKAPTAPPILPKGERQGEDFSDDHILLEKIITQSSLSSIRFPPPSEGIGEAAHAKWNTETGITHTPTFFINGKRLPGRYNLKDIEKMIPQLEETLINKKEISKQNQ